MPKYILPSSRKTFFEKGEVKPEVMLDLMKEAYSKRGLYAECEIQVKRKESNGSEIKENYFFVTYKELWDCYKILFGKEDFHPYDKIHPFSLGRAFIEKMKLDDVLDMHRIKGNLTVLEAKIQEQRNKKIELFKQAKVEEPVKRKRGRPRKNVLKSAVA